MAVIKPYDPSLLRPMAKAIRDSDLGVNPTDEGTIIRVVIPQLSQERRRDLPQGQGGAQPHRPPGGGR